MKYTRNVLTSLEPIGRVTAAVEGWDYLNALIQRHQRYESKRGVGIAAIVIGRNNPNRAIAFHLEQVDGSDVDISWIHCVKSSAPTPHQKLLSAMRLAIVDQKEQFKQNAKHPEAVCGICLKAIRPSDVTHVDHEPPFRVLVKEFVEESGSPSGQFDSDVTTAGARFSAADDDYSKRWQDYHARHAGLRLTHEKCNLSRQ